MSPPFVHGGIPVDIWSTADSIAYVCPTSERMARICDALVRERDAGASELAASQEEITRLRKALEEAQAQIERMEEGK